MIDKVILLLHTYCSVLFYYLVYGVQVGTHSKPKQEARRRRVAGRSARKQPHYAVIVLKHTFQDMDSIPMICLQSALVAIMSDATLNDWPRSGLARR